MLSFAEGSGRAQMTVLQVNSPRLKMRARKDTANRKTCTTGTTGREKVLAGTQDGIRVRNERTYCPMELVLRLQPAHSRSEDTLLCGLPTKGEDSSY